jgi:hypothetical protein
MKVLVKFDDNWADEMDVSGFKIFDNLDAWEKCVNEFTKNRFDGEEPEDDEENYFEVYFGTNEYNEYESMDEFISNFDIAEISDEEAVAIEKIFPESTSCGYGHFPL